MQQPRSRNWRICACINGESCSGAPAGMHRLGTIWYTSASLYLDVDNVPLGWQEIGMALPFAALLLASIMWFGTRFPMYQLWQPIGELELEGVQVEAEGQVVS